MLEMADEPVEVASFHHEIILGSANLSDRLRYLHDHLLERMPDLARIAFAIYDAKDDQLRTFINSTRRGQPIASYDYRLSDSMSLSALARDRKFRVLDELQGAISADTAHGKWLLDQGYRSSFTVPLFHGDILRGFLFFDSMQPAAFTQQRQLDLLLFGNMINMVLAQETSAVSAMFGAASLARDLTHMRDHETGAHLDRVSRVARLIAREVAPAHGLTDEFVERVFLFAPLHDIGKIAIPDAILLKPGPLTPEERAIMQGHVDHGVAIVDRIVADLDLKAMPDMSLLYDIVHGHHEMLDGSGYPRGLRGGQIPIAARIAAVADIFDALTTPRPYKSAWPFPEAIAELDRMVAAGKIDGECVAALKRHVPEAKAITERYQDPPIRTGQPVPS